MQRRELVRILEANGWKSRGGTNHEHFWKEGKMVMVNPLGGGAQVAPPLGGGIACRMRRR